MAPEVIWRVEPIYSNGALKTYVPIMVRASVQLTESLGFKY